MNNLILVSTFVKYFSNSFFFFEIDNDFTLIRNFIMSFSNYFFIVSSITSSGEEIWLVSKDGRVMKVHESVLKEHKKWDSMIEGYSMWLGSQKNCFSL